jgi:hypothetical protein
MNRPPDGDLQILARSHLKTTGFGFFEFIFFPPELKMKPEFPTSPNKSFPVSLAMEEMEMVRTSWSWWRRLVELECILRHLSLEHGLPQMTAHHFIFPNIIKCFLEELVKMARDPSTLIKSQ